MELKKYFLTLLENFGSFRYTRHTLEELDAELRAEVAKLGGNPMLEDFLDELLDWKLCTDEKHQEKLGSCFVMSNFSIFLLWLFE
jgi:hypothetical protein